MNHLVGLNQPRNESQLRDYLQYMETSIKKSAPGEEPTKPPDDRVYRGGLQLEELDLLRLYCGQICRGYEVLRENVSK